MYGRMSPIDSGQSVVFVFLIACFTLLAGSAFLLPSLMECQRGLATLGYETTQGQIVNSLVKTGGSYRRPCFALCVTYAYKDTQGQPHEGDTMDVQNACKESLQSEKLEKLKYTSYTPLTPIAVYYNRNEPSVSVLTRGVPFWSVLNVLWGALLLFLSFLFFRAFKQSFNFSKWV